MGGGTSLPAAAELWTLNALVACIAACEATMALCGTCSKLQPPHASVNH